MPRSFQGRAAVSLSGVALGVLLLVVAALVFVAIYLVLPGNDHFFALLTIGVLALVFALAGYLGSAATRDPTGVRLATWGFLGMGFAVLLLTLAVAPGNPYTLVGQMVGLILVVLLLAGVVAVAYWRAGTLGRERVRVARRQEWASTPAPSAFSYAAAQQTGAPPAPTPPASAPPPPPSGGPP